MKDCNKCVFYSLCGSPARATCELLELTAEARKEQEVYCDSHHDSYGNIDCLDCMHYNSCPYRFGYENDSNHVRVHVSFCYRYHNKYDTD